VYQTTFCVYILDVDIDIFMRYGSKWN